jgi:chromosomal replication initiation ATPase DnaA
VRDGDRTINDVLKAVAAHFEISREELVSGRAPRRARLLARYLAFRVTMLSFPQIGARTGGVTGTNVVFAVRTIERDMAKDADFAAGVEAIKASLLVK